jgi:serine/threonine-protein kinase
VLLSYARAGLSLVLTAAVALAPFAANATGPKASPAASASASAAAPTPAPDAGVETAIDAGTDAPSEPGKPTAEQCIDANETAQRLTRAGSLGPAQEQVEICLDSACPEPIRADCGELEKQIRMSMPTVVFEAHDKSGATVTAVKVTMDGKVIAEKLDGSPLYVTPGKHTFEFESPGLPRTSKTLVFNAGDKRSERVNMIDMTGPLLRTTGLVLAGIGVIAIGYGSYRGIRAKTTYDDALKHCPNGPNSCSAAGEEGGDEAHDHAAAATTSMVVGSLLVAGGAALYLLVPAEGFRVTPAVQQGGLSVTAGGTW